MILVQSPDTVDVVMTDNSPEDQCTKGITFVIKPTGIEARVCSSNAVSSVAVST